MSHAVSKTSYNRHGCFPLHHHQDAGASPTNFVFVNEAARQLVKLKGYEQTGIHFHSLLAETERGGAIYRFREFVVFVGKYTYPEFLLAYKRTSRIQPSMEEGVEPAPEQ